MIPSLTVPRFLIPDPIVPGLNNDSQNRLYLNSPIVPSFTILSL